MNNIDDERRSDPRTPISVKALVRFDSTDSWVCTIKDFCAGGMLLQGDRIKLLEAYDGEDGPSRGTGLEVHFAVRDNEDRAHTFHHHGEVARTLKDSLGVCFPTPLHAEALAALTFQAQGGADEGSIASKPGSPSFELEATVAASIRRSCADFSKRRMLKIGKEFVECYRDELVACHGRASTNEERERFALASNALHTDQRDLLKSFVSEIVGPFVNKSPKPVREVSVDPEATKATKSTKMFSNSSLSLVAKEEFEHWLVVADLASSYEGQLSEEMFVLQSWLGMVDERWKRKEANPCLPGAVIRALETSLRGLELAEEPARLAYETFDRSCRKLVVEYYDDLLNQLAETGLFPSVDEIISEHVKNTAPAPSEQRQVGEPARAVVAPQGRTPAAASALLNVAQSLGTEGNASGGSGAQLDAGGSAGGRSDVVRDPAPEVDLNEVLQALSNLPRNLDRQADREAGLKSALLNQLSERGPVQVPQRVMQALDMVDYMVRSVDEDEVLTDDLRKWMSKLEVTLGKEAARNEDFLNSNPESPHAAFQMLNQLEGVDADTIDMERGKRASARVDAVLHRLVEDWEGNSDAFVEAVEELEPLVEQQKKIHSRNVERVVNGCEGRAKLRRAKQIVLKCLAATFEGRKVPPVLLEILKPAWRNLLVNLALREGIRSTAWRQQLKVIRRLAEFLCVPDAPAAPPAAVRVLAKCVQDGFDSIGFRPRARLIEDLARQLADPSRRDREQAQLVPENGLAELLEWDALQDADPLPPAEGPERDQYLEMMRRARVLRTGSRLKFHDSDGEEKTSTLAWVAPSGEHFVFVNRRGLWDRELGLGALTEQLVTGTAVILDGYDVPLVERISERMLSRIHGKITTEAHKDELTELANRRSYEHALEKLIALARHTETAHCALQIDLDQFKIINSTCGYDGGDALLKELAAALRSEVEAVDGYVARIGADEFAALLRGKTLEQGQEIADRIVRRIRHMQFSWANTQHSVTTTIGVLGIDQSCEDGSRLMQNLAAACREGKDQGGDCVYLFVDNDEAMLEQRAVMKRASEVEKLLAEDRVRLNCQKIAPTIGGDMMDGHYEILITVLDDDGKPNSPVEFIEAAERYGKMPLVDRFVVSNALAWMSEHGDALENFGGFSINLSGQSIKQDDFLDFVLQQFEITNAPASKVCFEVTETAAMGNLSRAAEFIQKIRVMGCSFSLDDFGTGMSSYAYLRELPVDYLKIDGTFVKNMANDLSDQAVVKSINEVGHFMGKRTVAEYVHDEATMAAAQEIGVDFVQGWHVEKPQPIDQLLQSYPRRQAAQSA